MRRPGVFRRAARTTGDTGARTAPLCARASGHRVHAVLYHATLRLQRPDRTDAPNGSRSGLNRRKSAGRGRRTWKQRSGARPAWPAASRILKRGGTEELRCPSHRTVPLRVALARSERGPGQKSSQRSSAAITPCRRVAGAVGWQTGPDLTDARCVRLLHPRPALREDERLRREQLVHDLSLHR